MTETLEQLRARVAAQKTLIPSLYGAVDFSHTPERFTADPAEESALPGFFARKYRPEVLADAERVERARAYTMLGDTVADAYAALMPQYGFRRLVDMLTQACDHGVDQVPEAPAELRALIAAMEEVPAWVDMRLVRQGAKVSRNSMAILAPFVIRGAFVATFMNKYSGLPMALTGTLSDEAAVRRIRETASFFTTTTLPGALERFGTGFKAAAMVRLMHSMVRFNLLKRSKQWDVAIYGIPVPQVDQMPAGMMGAFLAAFNVIRNKRKDFTSAERAMVELSRYRCHLLGLPAELLPATPREIFNTMLTYGATLRDGYDDATCGELVRGTMTAYLPPDRSLRSRVFDTVERSASKVFFNRAFLFGDEKSRATLMGVQPSLKDYLLFGLSGLYVVPRMTAFSMAGRLPVVNEVADWLLTRRLNELLTDYGHAEYTTDPAKYRSTTA